MVISDNLQLRPNNEVSSFRRRPESMLDLDPGLRRGDDVDVSYCVAELCS